jgi:hypothetical protein
MSDTNREKDQCERCGRSLWGHEKAFGKCMECKRKERNQWDGREVQTDN